MVSDKNNIYIFGFYNCWIFVRLYGFHALGFLCVFFPSSDEHFIPISWDMAVKRILIIGLNALPWASACWQVKFLCPNVPLTYLCLFDHNHPKLIHKNNHSFNYEKAKVRPRLTLTVIGLASGSVISLTFPQSSFIGLGDKQCWAEKIRQCRGTQKGRVNFWLVGMLWAEFVPPNTYIEPNSTSENDCIWKYDLSRGN